MRERESMCERGLREREREITQRIALLNMLNFMYKTYVESQDGVNAY